MNNGWHENSNDDYHAGPGISSTGLKRADDCPYKYKNEPIRKKPSPALIRGSRLHEVCLGGSKPLKVAPDINRRTKAGREEWAEFVESSAGYDVCSQDEYDEVMRMHDAIMAHTEANDLLKGIYELSGYWNNDEYGLLKIRPDIRTPSTGTIADIKTIGGSADPLNFTRAVVNFKYHLSAAYYLDVANMIDAELGAGDKVYDKFAWIVVESAHPYTVAVYRPDPEMIEVGREIYHDALIDIARCDSTNDWPAYPSLTLTLPHWALP
jgi:exodeoxyribonuclease VIII